MLQEFLTIGTNPLHIRDILLVLKQLYKDIMRQEETVLNMLGFNMRKVNINYINSVEIIDSLVEFEHASCLPFY